MNRSINLLLIDAGQGHLPLLDAIISFFINSSGLNSSSERFSSLSSGSVGWYLKGKINELETVGEVDLGAWEGDEGFI